MRKQLIRFLSVGAAGYVVNLAVYAVCVHAVHIDYRAAAVVAFCFALTTTYTLNRRYTFAPSGARLHHEAGRYVLVSLVGFATNLIALQLLVDGAMLAKVPAQAIAIVIAAPVNFAGQRFWTFVRRPSAV
ncbi:MAG: hypothetical protein QOG68_2773 [Solirubrobacteraceae bacterium]|jgi:putative flippase GtrA|nr:hypothetical protein [Solirubrobacteraceae bacterium]